MVAFNGVDINIGPEYNNNHHPIYLGTYNSKKSRVKLGGNRNAISISTGVDIPSDSITIPKSYKNMYSPGNEWYNKEPKSSTEMSIVNSLSTGRNLANFYYSNGYKAE